MPLPNNTSPSVRLLLRSSPLLRLSLSPASRQNRRVLTAIRSLTAHPRLASSSAAASAASSASPSSTSPATTPSSMNLRRASFAIISGIVLTGAWYYRNSLSSLSGGLRPMSSSTASSSPADGSTESDVPGLRVLAVDEHSLYTGTLPAGEKVSKSVDSDGRKVVAMLTPEEATRKLRRNEESYLVGRGKGVWRYDVVQIPSNDPIEDDHAEKIIEVPTTVVPGDESSDWMFWGVFDGHSGWTTSAKLRQVLIGFVARELNSAYKAGVAPTPAAIDNAIKKGFTRLDDEIVNQSVERLFKNPSKLAAAEVLAPALSGSCAMLAFFDSRSKDLRIATTGDSRAVLGRRGKNGKWSATALSVDQTGSNTAEAARMRAEHPNEDAVIRNGRVLGGLEPTRAFGDAFYKWPKDIQLKLKEKFFGRTPSQLLKTPPYVTAEPVVTTTRIEPENGDFVVMATDGLWEMLTNEEVVGLVGKWINEQKGEVESSAGGKKGWFGGLLGGDKSEKGLPVEAEAGEEDEGGQRQPIRTVQWGVNGKAQEERFCVEDKNVATHLVRNALGGKNADMLCALLTLPSPYSRRYRDDLTVEVLFFGDGDKSGNVVVNEEATARINATARAEKQAQEKGSVAKPKL